MCSLVHKVLVSDRGAVMLASKDTLTSLDHDVDRIWKVWEYLKWKLREGIRRKRKRKRWADEE